MSTLSAQKRLDKRLSEQNLRSLKVIECPIDFASNDYLGLARSKKLLDLVHERIAMLSQLGSTGSRLLTGNSLMAEALEKKIAAFHGFESALLFNCGFMANLGLLSSIAESQDAIFFDSGVHASVREGIRLSAAPSFGFRHNDLDHLRSRLKRCTSQGDHFVCVESVYSMDGSLAPLEELCLLCEEFGANLVVDEAHAIGVFGLKGRGRVAELGLQTRCFATLFAFGKAVGLSGAVVCGSRLLMELLINFATSFIYTTALAHPIIVSIDCAYDLFASMEDERDKIKELSAQFRSFYPGSQSQIHSISIPGSERAKKVSMELALQGFDVRAVTSPTVRKGEEMLRLCLHSFNTSEELHGLQKKLAFL